MQATEKKAKEVVLFSIKDPIVSDFNRMLQVDVVTLMGGNVLHIIDVGTGFQNGCFSQNMDVQTT